MVISKSRRSTKPNAGWSWCCLCAQKLDARDLATGQSRVQYDHDYRYGNYHGSVEMCRHIKEKKRAALVLPWMLLSCRGDIDYECSNQCWSARKPQAGARRQRTTRESSLLEIVGIWVTCLRVFTDRLRVWITCVWLLSTYQSGSSPVVRLPCDFCYRELQGWVIYKFVSVLSCFRNTVRENWSINLDVKGIYYLLHNRRRRRKFWHFYTQQMHF